MMLQKYLWGFGALVTSALLLTSGQVAAQGQSASAAAMLEEIVVTARRREENLQELPLSIQAISADAMQAQGIYNMKDLTDFVPNVVLTEDQRQNDTRLFIRGIGGGFSNPAQVFFTPVTWMVTATSTWSSVGPISLQGCSRIWTISESWRRRGQRC